MTLAKGQMTIFTETCWTFIESKLNKIGILLKHFGSKLTGHEMKLIKEQAIKDVA